MPVARNLPKGPVACCAHHSVAHFLIKRWSLLPSGGERTQMHTHAHIHKCTAGPAAAVPFDPPFGPPFEGFFTNVPASWKKARNHVAAGKNTPSESTCFTAVNGTCTNCQGTKVVGHCQAPLIGPIMIITSLILNGHAVCEKKAQEPHPLPQNAGDRGQGLAHGGS